MSCVEEGENRRTRRQPLCQISIIETQLGTFSRSMLAFWNLKNSMFCMKKTKIKKNMKKLEYVSKWGKGAKYFKVRYT